MFIYVYIYVYIYICVCDYRYLSIGLYVYVEIGTGISLKKHSPEIEFPFLKSIQNKSPSSLRHARDTFRSLVEI